MLVGGAFFARRRVAFLLAAAAAFGAATLAWYLAILSGSLPRPNGSSPVGYTCGIIGFVIIVFEMLLWPRKALRGLRLMRWLGSTRLWMFLHVWLGLLSFPLVFAHSGFLFGRLVESTVTTSAGSLSTVLMTLYIVVIASGVFGLVMQQVIPRKLLDDIPAETIATQRHMIAGQLLDEARALVARVRLPFHSGESEHGAVATLTQAETYRTDQLNVFFDRQIAPYLQNGTSTPQPLAAPGRAQQLFADLRRDAGGEFAALVDRLERICDTRRQLDRQYNLYWWLHSWLCVHVPLSFALFVLVLVHIGFALKYW